VRNFLLDFVHCRDHGQGTINFPIEKCVGPFLYISEHSVFFKCSDLISLLVIGTANTVCTINPCLHYLLWVEITNLKGCN